MSQLPYSPIGRNRKIAFLWLTIPMIALLVVLLAFAVLNIILSGFQHAVGGVEPALLSGGNYFLSIAGLVSVVAVPVGFIVGAVYATKDNMREGEYDGRSGMGGASVVPAEVRGWNWGAAGLSYLWGYYYRSWYSLLVFVPLVNIIWWVVLGIYGNQWAWEKNSWRSVEEFQASQKKWRIWGIISLIISFIAVLAPMFFGVALGSLLG